jgi:dimethylglycine dehydrogenase
VNYVGELGWELHVPMAGMQKVFDALMAAGEAHGIRLFGTYAMNSLRMEKSYRGWGGELTNEVTMVDADMERFLDTGKEFIGRAATQRAQQQGGAIKLIYLAVEAADSDCYGNEPVYQGDRLVGITTSGAFGHRTDRSLAFAYVEPALASAGQNFDILMLGVRRKAVALSAPAWDPKNERLRM